MNPGPYYVLYDPVRDRFPYNVFFNTPEQARNAALTLVMSALDHVGGE